MIKAFNLWLPAYARQRLYDLFTYRDLPEKHLIISICDHFDFGSGGEYNEGEEEKIKMSEPVQQLVKSAISPLAREIRSSIDFFERQNDVHVQRIYACGGSACSAPLLTILGEAVGTPVECWNAVERLDVSQLNGEAQQVLAAGPSLAAAVGVAAARLN